MKEWRAIPSLDEAQGRKAEKIKNRRFEMKKMQQVKPLTGEDVFWVAVIIFGLPFIVWMGGGHIG